MTNLKPILGLDNVTIHDGIDGITITARGDKEYGIDMVSVLSTEETIKIWNTRTPPTAEWQPIETAPTGKDILVKFGNGVRIANKSRALESWYSEYGHCLHTPTHWMELPKLITTT